MIPIERRGSQPIFRQIVDYFRRAIEAGRLQPGAKLQPVRVLAAELGVNRETVADAYRDLEALGLTESTVGRGTFVLARAANGAARAPVVAPPPFVPVFSAAADATAALPAVDFTADARAVRMERLVPDLGLHLADDFRKALNGILLRGRGRALLDYGDPRGHRDLRDVLVERLARAGIEADADDVVVTAGSTQALAIVGRLFCNPGAAVAVEAPAYPGAYATFTALGLRPVPVPMTADGLDLDTLDALLARGRAQLVYTMPTFQNPTGFTTTLAHRHRLLEVAARHGVPVVEDDFQKDLRVAGRPVAALRALDPGGRVVYVGSLSKSLFPGPRIGWIVGSRPVADAATAMKRAVDLSSSPLLQAAVARFCRDGTYDRHLRRAVKEIDARRTRAFAALERHLPPGSIFTRPEGGFVLWVTLPSAVDTVTLLPTAKRAGVVYAPGSVFYTDGRRSSALRLSLAQVGPDEIERGIAVLGEVARAALPTRRARRSQEEPQPVHV